MPHAPDDVLTEMAFGNESVRTPRVTAHLRRCVRCRTELAALRDVVRAVRTATAADLPLPPPARLWPVIRAEIEGTGRPPDSSG
ncbi:hypothetical protein [uncultured Streptomyces sp.]|uniref:hypothetical protein n=1 Tax=uncultured Streptomyces sp. TaxID=174707 RepID=UPI00262B1489|nr:hypothetical protein [uncultured Streptomyces sp.]